MLHMTQSQFNKLYLELRNIERKLNQLYNRSKNISKITDNNKSHFNINVKKWETLIIKLRGYANWPDDNWNPKDYQMWYDACKKDNLDPHYTLDDILA